MKRRTVWIVAGAIAVVAAVALVLGITYAVNLQNERDDIARCSVIEC